MTETLHITVRGRVQGVGFRAFTVAIAREHGIVGWVMNAPDGRSVEMYARGAPEEMRAFVERVRQGPPASYVERCESHPIDTDEEFARFIVRH